MSQTRYNFSLVIPCWTFSCVKRGKRKMLQHGSLFADSEATQQILFKGKRYERLTRLKEAWVTFNSVRICRSAATEAAKAWTTTWEERKQIQVCKNRHFLSFLENFSISHTSSVEAGKSGRWVAWMRMSRRHVYQSLTSLTLQSFFHPSRIFPVHRIPSTIEQKHRNKCKTCSNTSNHKANLRNTSLVSSNL